MTGLSVAIRNMRLACVSFGTVRSRKDQGTLFAECSPLIDTPPQNGKSPRRSSPRSPHAEDRIGPPKRYDADLFRSASAVRMPARRPEQVDNTKIYHYLFYFFNRRSVYRTGRNRPSARHLRAVMRDRANNGEKVRTPIVRPSGPNSKSAASSGRRCRSWRRPACELDIIWESWYFGRPVHTISRVVGIDPGNSVGTALHVDLRRSPYGRRAQTNLLRRMNQVLPNSLRPVSRSKFVALAFFATAVPYQETDRSERLPSGCGIFSDSIGPRAQSSASSQGADSKTITNGFAPRRIMEFAAFSI